MSLIVLLRLTKTIYQHQVVLQLGLKLLLVCRLEPVAHLLARVTFADVGEADRQFVRQEVEEVFVVAHAYWLVT